MRYKSPITSLHMNTNIGDNVSWKNEYGDTVHGKIKEVASDMDSYEDMELKDGVPYYASKKLTAAENKRRKANGKKRLRSPVYAPVKPKNMGSVFLIIERGKGREDFVYLNEVNKLFWKDG